MRDHRPAGVDWRSTTSHRRGAGTSREAHPIDMCTDFVSCQRQSVHRRCRAHPPSPIVLHDEEGGVTGRCLHGRLGGRAAPKPCRARTRKSSSSSANPKIFHYYQSVPAIAQIVDAARSSHYGPRGLEGAGNRNRKRRAGVMTMSDKARGGKEPDMPDTEEAALSARLRSLGDRLGSQRPNDSTDIARDRPRPDASGLARGFRLCSELVAGVLVGAVIGWAIDRTLGVSPWGMIIFLLSGFAAGVLNVVRAAGIAPGSSSSGDSGDAKDA